MPLVTRTVSMSLSASATSSMYSIQSVGSLYVKAMESSFYIRHRPVSSSGVLNVVRLLPEDDWDME